MKYTLEKTDMYSEWFKKQAAKIQRQVDDRLQRIIDDSHFGTVNNLGDGLAELKFNNGIRIYFRIKSHNNKIAILILGGNKNGQQKDINKAKKVLS